MELLVDFNMTEADGRIPALVEPQQVSALAVGSGVLAFDGEGTRCRAVVTEISSDGRLVMLLPLEGTVQPSDRGPSTSGTSHR
jgi:hypothetical protein